MTDLSPLSSIAKRISTLTLSNTAAEDYAPLKKLTGLKSLTLDLLQSDTAAEILGLCSKSAKVLTLQELIFEIAVFLFREIVKANGEWNQANTPPDTMIASLDCWFVVAEDKELMRWIKFNVILKQATSNNRVAAGKVLHSGLIHAFAYIKFTGDHHSLAAQPGQFRGSPSVIVIVF